MDDAPSFNKMLVTTPRTNILMNDAPQQLMDLFFAVKSALKSVF